jgi:hypothetical protein
MVSVSIVPFRKVESVNGTSVSVQVMTSARAAGKIAKLQTKTSRANADLDLIMPGLPKKIIRTASDFEFDCAYRRHRLPIIKR